MNYQILHNLSTEYIQSLKARFWAKVDTSGGSDACWEWTASCDTPGYGQIGVGRGRPVGAHRVSYELNTGPIPEGMFICHKCDNRKCVNPGHLFLGSNRDNVIDMALKGRGDYHLDPEQVAEIRERHANGISTKRIAREYGIHPTHVNRIARGDSWGFAP